MPDPTNVVACNLTDDPTALAKALPTQLDDIIRQHRDIAHCHLSTAEEINQILKTLPDSAYPEITGELTDWRLITYRAAPPGVTPATHIHLLGYKGVESWITSPIHSLDLGTRLAITASGSVYRMLGERGQGEPPLNHLLQVCGAFWKWGRGETLGVLHVF